MTSAGEVTIQELNAMIGRDAEGPYLEFKVDIPVHKQSQREQRDRNINPPRDAWWAGKPLADYGRDKLLEEVVAFANARGGRLYLGIDEDAGTALAKAICPLPRVTALEARFRDYLLSGVEPRLPQSTVRAIETDAQGNGILLVEVQASRLGPHRVTNSLQVPIRRGDKCTPMTMPEVQEMVLRNARRFDEVRATLAARANDLGPAFHKFLASRIDLQFSGGTEDERIDSWLKQSSYSACTTRVTLCAHDDIGIERLATFDTLIPPESCIVEQTPHGLTTPQVVRNFWPQLGHSERFLGGVRQAFPWGAGHIDFGARREGIVEQTVFEVGPPGQIIQTSQQLAGCLGCCMGIYDQLRTAANNSTMPAEVAITVLTHGKVLAANQTMTATLHGGRLPVRLDFPRRTISDSSDCTDLLNITIQDFLDAANASMSSVSRFIYSPP